MEIDRNGEAGAEEEFEKRNYWIPKSDCALERTVPAVLRYIESRRDQRINAMTAEFMQPERLKPLTQKEEVIVYRKGKDIHADLKYLYLAYRKYARDPDADNAYRIAVVLNKLLQFSLAIPWFEKVVRADPDDLTSKVFLMMTYYQCEKVEEARKTAEEVLEYTDDEDFDYKSDVYIRLSDCCYSKGEDREAVYWLDRIIEECNDPDYVKYVEGVKKERMLQIDD
jgi:tetratricopeptide (TPR) repeat protein